MPAVFGSTTFGNADGTPNNSKGNAKGAQDMIGTTAALRAASAQMQNGHIGASQAQVVTPQAAALLIAAQDTPAVKSDGSAIKWASATGTWVVGP